MPRAAPPPAVSPALTAWQRLRFALSAAGMGTWHLDLDTGIATFDENLNRIFGLPAIETQQPLPERLARVHPDDREHVRQTMDHAIATRSEFQLVFRVLTPDGAVRWVRDRGKIFVDDRGAPLFATGAVADITDQRHGEERERLLADATRLLAGAAPIERALASIAETLVPRFAPWCGIHLRSGDRVVLAAAAGAAHRQPGDALVAQVMDAGRTLVEPTLLIVPLRCGLSAAGTLSCAADHAFDEEDLQFASELADRIAPSVDRARLFDDLERANRVKDEFLATLSHELRTPLNAVLGWTRILRRGTMPPDRTMVVLDTIERNAAAQMQLVEELLDLSAMTSGALRLSVARVDLRELLRDAVETMRPAAEAKSIAVSLTLDDRAGTIPADAARLQQVLWNLLVNAVKFTPAGGAIGVSLSEGAADVEIVVADSGPGLPPEFLPFAFDPFRQADAGAHRPTGGLGLGLTIVRHIVEAHGGTVSVRNGDGGSGAIFTVRLPMGALSRETRGGDEAALRGFVRSVPANLRGRRVLAVDDDESTQDLVATMLLMYGVSVRTAGRSAEALKILTEWRPDVLLTDIAMPGEDGYTLMRRVRDLPQPLGSIPAVALTAYTDADSVQQAFAVGFDAHLGKPLEPHLLADTLAKVLRRRV